MKQKYLKQRLEKRNKIKERRGLSLFLGETIKIINTRKRNIKPMQSTPVDLYPSNIPVVIEKYGEVYDMKQLGFHTQQMKFFNPDVLEFLSNNEEYFVSDDIGQLAFGISQSSTYWKKYLDEHSEGKMLMFSVFDGDFLLKPDELLDRNISS